MVREQLDDLEQYTRRTNIRIFGIPEPTGTDPEDIDKKAIEFFSNQLGKPYMETAYHFYL